LIVKDSNGDYIGVEYKGTQWAASNPPTRQVRADGWIEANGGEIFGSNAQAADMVGGVVTKVILLGPSTAARK
jgi:alkylation response protein AidB-like acyl-CoA dehydrogenase